MAGQKNNDDGLKGVGYIHPIILFLHPTIFYPLVKFI